MGFSNRDGRTGGVVGIKTGLMMIYGSYTRAASQSVRRNKDITMTAMVMISSIDWVVVDDDDAVETGVVSSEGQKVHLTRVFQHQGHTRPSAHPWQQFRRCKKLPAQSVAGSLSSKRGRQREGGREGQAEFRANSLQSKYKPYTRWLTVEC